MYCAYCMYFSVKRRRECDGAMMENSQFFGLAFLYAECFVRFGGICSTIGEPPPPRPPPSLPSIFSRRAAMSTYRHRPHATENSALFLDCSPLSVARAALPETRQVSAVLSGITVPSCKSVAMPPPHRQGAPLSIKTQAYYALWFVGGHPRLA